MIPSLLSDLENRKRIRDHLAAAAAASSASLGGCAWGWWRRWRSVVGGNHEDVVRLRVERQCLAAHFRLQALLDDEAGWAVFLDDRQRPVALRAERLHRRGIEYCAVRAHADRQRRENLSVVGVEHDHVLRAAAPSNQNPVLRIGRG